MTLVPAGKKTGKKPARKKSAKKATAKKVRRKSATRKAPRKATKKGEAVKPKATAPRKAPPKKVASKATRKKAAKKKPPSKPPEKTRIVFPMDVYQDRKKEIKTPFKNLDLKWQYLGPGKGRYHKEGVNVFVQYTDAGADFTYWGEDQPALRAIGKAWQDLPTVTGAVEAEEKEEEESEAMRIWRLAEPRRRPGEPDFFFERRRTEWQASKPGD